MAKAKLVKISKEAVKYAKGRPKKNETREKAVPAKMRRTRLKEVAEKANLPIPKDIYKDLQPSCKYCESPILKFRIADMSSRGYSIQAIIDTLKGEEKIPVSREALERHIKEHEAPVAPWLGLIQNKFPSEEERKKFESAFIARISLVLELYKPYQTMKEIFETIVGEPNSLNPMIKVGKGPDNAVKLSAELRAYLETLLKLQKERDVIVEIAKVVLFMASDKLLERLGFVIMDLSWERKEAIGKIVQEEVKRAIEYAKTFGRERVDDMLSKAKSDYDKLVNNLEQETGDVSGPR